MYLTWLKRAEPATPCLREMHVPTKKYISGASIFGNATHVLISIEAYPVVAAEATSLSSSLSLPYGYIRRGALRSSIHESENCPILPPFFLYNFPCFSALQGVKGSEDNADGANIQLKQLNVSGGQGHSNLQS